MAILAFQKPDKVIMQKSNDFDGTFEFRPLEPGFGVTIGNSLRRILLSSLEGYAITSVRFSDVSHEFSTIKGVAEDVVDIILNLKQVRFKKTGDSGDNEKIFVIINGQQTFNAGDITKFSNNFEVLNPDFVICNMADSVTLELELTINKGRGYVAAEENKNPDALLGVIAIDSIYTPIKNRLFVSLYGAALRGLASTVANQASRSQSLSNPWLFHQRSETRLALSVVCESDGSCLPSGCRSARQRRFSRTDLSRRN